MALLDWAILIAYFVVIVGLSIWIGRRQRSGTDYFLGGKRIRSGLIAGSLAANQVSAISLVGAPAFVALSAGGGLRWLQYEFAVPLAMIGIIFLIAPLYRRLTGATIYEYAEKRFGLSVRLALSAIFMFSRGLAGGVMLYTSALVLAVALQMPLGLTLLIIGIVAIIYTTIGGITADIYSDAIQLLVLWAGTILALLVALSLVGGFEAAAASVHPDRMVTIDLIHHGFGDGHHYSLWPMLIGGFFLYMSYYGCDQSQAQRLMSSPSARSTRNSLLINGLIRFPVVLSYCLLGLLLAVFVSSNPEWVSTRSIENPNNLIPAFIIDFLPPGAAGLMMAGIFAATMSSIDSAINSLSAVTMSDFVARFRKDIDVNHPRFLLWSRLTTLIWGGFCVASAFLFSQTTETVIELVNKIGSAFYGPILAVFLAGALLKRANSTGALTGLSAGLAANVALWIHAPGVSWLWWNPVGFAITFSASWVISFVTSAPSEESVKWMLKFAETGTNHVFAAWLVDFRTWLLVAAFIITIGISALLGNLK